MKNKSLSNMRYFRELMLKQICFERARALRKATRREKKEQNLRNSETFCIILVEFINYSNSDHLLHLFIMYSLLRQFRN
jgi:hypothetical protein